MKAATAIELSPQPVDGGEQLEHPSAFFSVIRYFRETNAEGQRIRQRLAGAQSLADSSGDQAAASKAFYETWQVIRMEVEAAKVRAAGIEGFQKTDQETCARYARELVQVANAWDDLNRLWPSQAAAVEMPVLVARGKESIRVLDNMIFTCACQSIPNELDEYLKNYRIGKPLDFIATFKDQLPDEAATRAVLAELAPQSGVVSGLIDLENARVIKADPRRQRQAGSVALVLGIAGLGFGLIAIAVHLGSWFQFSPTDWQVDPAKWAALNGAYLLVLLGVLGHWVLDRVKQNRAGTEVTPLAEWLIWIHINEVPIIIRIASVWLILLLGIAFKTFDLTKGVQPLTYFLAGYFMDSTFDALIGRLNTFIGENDPDNKKTQKAVG